MNLTDIGGGGERTEKDLSDNRSHSSFLTTSIAANSTNAPPGMGTHLKKSEQEN